MKKGFTLIEILVAVAIFSIALVLSSGIFSLLIGNQSMVSVNSEVNNESERIIRQISDDVVSANVPISYKNIAGATASADKIIFFNSNWQVITPDSICQTSWNNPNCDFAGFAAASSQTSGGNKTFKLKIYRLSGNNLQYADMVENQNPDGSLTLFQTPTNQIKTLAANAADKNYYTFNQLNSDQVEVPNLLLSGESCGLNQADCVSFIRINLEIQTANYQNLAARHRADVILRTLVATRNYQ